jgi:hypothetical protein
MPDRTFSDQEQQLIVRLGDEVLAYVPAAGPGWQCRLDDISFTSSVAGSKGLTEVRLHAADGRVAVRIPLFEQIERFYVALVRQLAERPQFDKVRGNLPDQVALLERVLWLAAQQPDPRAPWDALAVTDRAAVAGTADGLLLARFIGAKVEQWPWKDVAGVRSRRASASFPHAVLRFYTTDHHADLYVEEDHETWIGLCGERMPRDRAEPEIVLTGGDVASADVAMDYSWEIEAAAHDGLLKPEETVLACAFGHVERDLSLEAEPLTRTELILTDRHLIRVDREVTDGTLLAHGIVPTHRMPRIRRVGPSLFVNREELRTDSAQPLDMAGPFWKQYRGLMVGALNPFSDTPDEEEMPDPAEGRPDPFAPDVESVPAR